MKVFLSSFSALDRYFGIPTGAYINILTENSLVDFAREFESPSYPGIDGIDVIISDPRGEHLIRCDADPGDLDAPKTSEDISLLNLLCESETGRFVDPSGVYESLRDRDALTPLLRKTLNNTFRWESFLNAAVLISRYPYNWTNKNMPSGNSEWEELPLLIQKIGLVRILEGSKPHEGLRFLNDCGFIEAHWPEIHAMVPVEQGKEHHPEGNVWEHTLATFDHRKGKDLKISLALLLHDMGKPLAVEEEGRRFNKHAQLGRNETYRFLRRLGFDNEILEDVGFLVGQHMIPGISRNIPPGRIRDTLSSPLYPLLLEVYRCDLSSTYRGPDGYYQACKVYRAFLKNSKNPFRGVDGKKMLKLYVDA